MICVYNFCDLTDQAVLKPEWAYKHAVYLVVIQETKMNSSIFLSFPEWKKNQTNRNWKPEESVWGF